VRRSWREAHWMGEVLSSGSSRVESGRNSFEQSSYDSLAASSLLTSGCIAATPRRGLNHAEATIASEGRDEGDDTGAHNQEGVCTRLGRRV
jgi:hypothetical protein